MKKINFIILGIFLVSVLVVSGCASNNGTTDLNNAVSGEKITVFKSPTCGCCIGWVAEMRKSGYNIEVKEMNDMSSIRSKYNIPSNMQSCHTAVVGDYFIEGHVPIEAVNKLLTEKPDVDGIALPRMPAGSPGMPGVKNSVWTIYTLNDGSSTNFMAI
ncbi:hypothetical protein CMO93_03525 [Candidatus Woesearchaeota archaeon]|nr:hypothetical protein [Candidatus Woesearchaeota archaeon]|tara:strand:- start:1574 stop:2047 length:474 start_codon:yes stop_codon:yes gene_type:complete